MTGQGTVFYFDATFVICVVNTSTSVTNGSGIFLITEIGNNTTVNESK